MKDFYHILGVHRDATLDEIKRAYRRLAKQLHPDTNHGNESAKRKFHEVSEAYKVLSNPDTRRRYDIWGHEAYVRMGGRTAWEAWQHTAEDEHAHSHGDGHCGACGHDHEHGHGGDGHCGACGGHEHGHEHSYTAEDGHCGACEEHRVNNDEADDAPPPRMVRTAVHLSYQESLTGAEKWAKIHMEDGSTRKVHVKIPPRTYSNCYYILEEVLCDDETEVLPKNIVVIVLLDEQPGYRKQSYHLYSTKMVDFTDLVLGGCIEIDTIDGKFLYEIKPGTRNGARIRLQGRGLWMPPKVGNRGDHYVTLEVEVPKKLNEGQLEALMAYRRATSGCGDEIGA